MNDLEPVTPELEGGGHHWWFVCSECHTMIDLGDYICPTCHRPINWNEANLKPKNKEGDEEK